jgi:hypothetical protein
MKRQKNQRRQSSLPASILAIIVLLLVMGCQTVSDTFNPSRTSSDKTTSSENTSSVNGKSIAAIPGLDGYWETDDKSVVIVFREKSFQFNETKSGSPKLIGTFVTVNENTVEAQAADKPAMRITDIKVSGDSLTLTVDGKPFKAHRIA